MVEVLPTTTEVKLIDKKEFAKAAVNKKLETFIVHVSALKATRDLIYPFQAAQIVTLQWDKVFIKIPTKYIDYIKVFFIQPSNTAS